jgi:hypothetical protein
MPGVLLESPLIYVDAADPTRSFSLGATLSIQTFGKVVANALPWA